ncbi:MAG: SDR family NAD(P)-dependent oxidoreductase [Candidatus Hydrogenedentes bacterium]|nr:SDR family NAD(P)-dependent oxidoreductase [Candidatus Hydrogenedentota bacterium]
MKTREAIQAWMIAHLSAELGVDEKDIDPQGSFDGIGLSSREAVSLSGELEDWLGRRLSPTLLWEYPSISALAGYLASEPAVAEVPARAPADFREPIAVVGMACRFPGAEDLDAFWNLLIGGMDAVHDVPADRWDNDAYYDPNPAVQGKMYTRKGGFLDRIDLFDAGFFGISPREASRMDPQQRMIMEVAWEALEHAGIAPDSLGGSPTGVFTGISANDYSHVQFGNPDLIDAYAGTGNAHSLVANRVSYFLDLRGPSLAVDTACSSSLVAVHQAVQSLRSGECALALAGGVNVILSPEVNMIFSHARMMSPDGRCKTFDASADGYVRGEGCGIVVLKRLADAVASGDRILAVLRGSAANHDGRSNGLTAPNGLAQQAVVRQALADAGLDPSDIGYVEAHGTGTSLGDPIEVDALKAVLLQGRDSSKPLFLGSAKTNIGHLESAAGIAGLIKAVLMLQHREIPPHLHLTEVNPLIELSGTPIEIATQRKAWVAGAAPRRAGISSFGFGGTNAHVILEEHALPVPFAPAAPERPRHVLALSAQNEKALKELAGRYADRLAALADDRFPDFCHSANAGRAQFEHRLLLAPASREAAMESLATYARDGKSDGASTGSVRRGERPKLAMVFTGQGSQYAGMGRLLYETQPVFRDALNACDLILRDLREQTLLSVFYPAEGEVSPIDETSYTQPALFAIEFALAELWKSWGIVPDAVMGHSVGEYVAACVAGVFSLEDGLRLIAERSRLMGALPEGGAMVAVLTDLESVQAALAGYEESVSVAAANGPKNTVISGDADAVGAVVKGFEARGVTCKPLTVSHAFHSPLMEPMLDEFEAAAQRVRYNAPRIPVVSNLTGRLVTGPGVFDAQYWRGHVRQAVQFDAGVRALSEAGYNLFLEAGPAPVLSGMGVRCLPRGAATWLPSLSKGKDDWAVLLQSLATLHCAGVNADWRGFDSPYARRKMDLPTYPFQRQRYWLDADSQTPEKSGKSVSAAHHSPCAAALNGLTDWLYQVRWVVTDSKGSAPARSLRCLVLADALGVGKALGAHLTAEGHTCVCAVRGESYAVSQPGHLTIRPACPEDYEKALQELGGPVDRVIHLWSLDTCGLEDASPEALAQAREFGCESAVHLAKAVYAQWSSGKRESSASSRCLWFVTRGAQSVHVSPHALSPVQASLWGFGRCLAIEHADLWGGLIDLDPTEDVSAECLASSITAPSTEDQLAFRTGRRYVARVHRTADLIEQAMPLPQFQDGWTCQPDVAYLITGGLGGLGLRVAEWLADHGAKHLILMSRSALPPRSAWDDAAPGSELARRVLALQRLESRGVTVQTAPVDVADETQLATFLDGYRREGFPPIRGIVHSAGVLDDHAVLQLDAKAIERVFKPKVTGGWLLHRAFNGVAESPLDFFVMFSSAASVLGSPGQANYAAANAFMDALAHYRRAKGLPALCVNWGPWAEIGMAADSRVRDRLAKSGIMSIKPQDGLAVLECLVTTDSAQVGVMDTDWELVARRLPAMGRCPALSELIGVPSPEAVPPPWRQDALRTDSNPDDMNAYLARQLAQVLYCPAEAIPHDRNFLELGLDSIMMMEVLNSLERDLGLKLFPKEVIDRPTIRDLAPYLAGEVARAKSDTIADVPPAPQATGHTGLLVARRRLRTTVAAVRNKPVAFLLSGPRSGSTLLRVMLAGHPGLFCPPELHLLQFNSMREWHEDLGRSYLGEGLQRAFMETRNLDAAQAKALLDDLVDTDAPVEHVYAMLQNDVAERLLIDKSPTYASAIETLEHAERLFDGAKYIHLVRHPYSTIESFMRNRFERLVTSGEADSMTLGEDVWAMCNANVRDFVRPMLTSKHHLVKYEDLVSDPEKTMRALCAFLEVPYDAAVLKPYEGKRMTDGVHAQSAPVGDPNFLKHTGIDPALGTVWKRIRLPRRLGGFARRVADELGYALPVEETLSASGEPNVAQTVQHVIRIQPKGDESPFFCVAPAGGIAYTYFNLPQYIGEDTPFYALQDPSLNPIQEPYESLQELASEHVAAIRAIQPEGPYYIGGWSFGGAVAFEMAQQLTHAGHTVGLLAIIDTEARIESWHSQSFSQRLKWFWNHAKMSVDVISRTGPYIRDGIYLLLPSALKKARSNSNEPSFREYVLWAWADALRDTLLKRAAIANVVTRDSRLMLIRQPSTRRILKVLRANWKILLAYAPQPYDGVITLLRAEDQSVMHKLHEDPTLGWGEVARGGLDVITVPGNHAVLLIKPYIETVGATIKECLIRARAKYEAK